MTTYTLMQRQTVPSNTPDAPAPRHVVLSGSPTRGRATFSLNPQTASYAQASIWAQTAITPYNYAENIPLLVMGITQGQRIVQQDLPLNLAYYDFLFRIIGFDRSRRTGGGERVFGGVR